MRLLYMSLFLSVFGSVDRPSSLPFLNPGASSSSALGHYRFAHRLHHRSATLFTVIAFFLCLESLIFFQLRFFSASFRSRALFLLFFFGFSRSLPLVQAGAAVVHAATALVYRYITLASELDEIDRDQFRRLGWGACIPINRIEANRDPLIPRAATSETPRANGSRRSSVITDYPRADW